MLIQRPLPHRISGDLALDFANTISWRGTDREIDHLADVEAILAWAEDVGLVDAGFRVPPRRRKALVDEVQRLRAAINAAGAAIAHRQSPPDTALACVRDFAARGLAAASLTGAPVRFSFASEHRIVAQIAWAALDLLRNGELDRLKQCPPDDCRWLFIDRTKNRTRRWCDMAACGNRAKVRRSRAH